ncbi:MAG: hypothetical protein WKF70_04570 [Chitinophagaceae bacterium]
MRSPGKIYNRRRWVVIIIAGIVLVLTGLSLTTDYLVIPLLKKRLHTLIVQGSDSLYTYTLGNLDASLLTGQITIENLAIVANGARYKELEKTSDLPPLTLQLNMVKGEVEGLSILPLLFNRKIAIRSISTKNANVRLYRHLVKSKTVTRKHVPLWKAIQPSIKGISIQTINLEGIKLLYRNADTTTAVKLQFDTCNAVFNHLRIDSVAATDPTRVGFSKEVTFRFSDLKFRSADSSSKLKAASVTYSSKTRRAEINRFKLQPTLEEKQAFYSFFQNSQAMNVIEFERAILTNFGLDQFINDNRISADSLLLQSPGVDIYVDKTFPAAFSNKIGTYPHQRLLNAAMQIAVKSIAVRGANISYTEKAARSKQEGTLTLADIDMDIKNVTNLPGSIKENNRCDARISGTILGNSPINARFIFDLDSANGSFEASGNITNVDAAQLNRLAVPLANVQFESFNLRELNYSLRGNDDKTVGTVVLAYDKLFLTIRKRDRETGIATTNDFLTKIVNKYTLQPSNPAPGKKLRTANVTQLRLTSQGFFGLIWKSVFGGMQSIMLNDGQTK